MTDATNPPSTNSAAAGAAGRHLGVVGFVVLVVIYLAVIQGGGQLLTIGRDVGYLDVSTIDMLWRTILVPVGVSMVLTYGVIAWLGWWRPVWVDNLPVRRWVIIVPIIMILSILVVTDYAGLVGKGLTFSLLLLLGSLMVGFTEEAMFRGLGVTVFRRRGFTEGKVALWSTLIFGLAHSSNLITEGPRAFLQVLATIIAGYFFYLIRRRTGGLLIPALVHALWDFSLISGQVTPGRTYALAIVAVVTMIVLAIIVLVRRTHIEPTTSATTTRVTPDH